ncbi:MAG: MerR family transcriptional regulator [Verrucomicrobiaceae bacterium]|jgi:hypothetical protein|nr:MerR family transcriptional regulator [Verrucomicrobiaceae bacterium]
MTYRYEITCLSESRIERSLLTTIDEAAELCGLHLKEIEEFLSDGLVKGFKDPQGSIFFDQAGISRLRHIAYLLQTEQTNLRTIHYIASLLDSLEAKESELRELRERLR